MFDKNMPLIKEEHYLIDDIKEFFLEATYEKITINITGKDEITVRQFGEPSVDKEYTCSFGNGVLHLNFPGRHIVGFFDFSLYRKNIEIEIEMPLKYYNAIKVNAISGSIKINGHPSWSDVNIENKSGRISIQKIECSTLFLKSSSGSINLDSATVKNQSNIKASSGSIRLNELKSLRSSIEAKSGSIHCLNIECENELLISTNSGSIKAERVSCESFNMNLTSGSLSLSYLNGCGNVFTSSGSVRVRSFKMCGNTFINTSSGSVHTSLAPTQNYSLNIKTSSGSINSRNPLYYEGNTKNRAAVTIGDGSSGTLSVSTSSGSVHIS